MPAGGAVVGAVGATTTTTTTTRSRRQYWGLLVVLALSCSALYLLLYYRVSLASPSTLLFSSHSSSSHHHHHLRGPAASLSDLRPKTEPLPPLALFNWTMYNFSSSSSSSSSSSNNVVNLSASTGNSNTNSSNNKSSNSNSSSSSRSLEAAGGSSGRTLLTLFSTWVDRDDLQVLRRLTLRNWAQLKPLVNPVLFSNDSKMAAEARRFGWQTLPVSRSAIGGVPVLKNMYLDAMSRFNSTLYAFANGDILFTDSLLGSLIAILKDPSLPIQKHPLLVIGQRTNVAMVTDQEALTFANITRVAKVRGKLFTTMAEDFFITDSRFPWSSIPGVVVGRAAYDNWLVLHAIQNKHVVVDVTKTAPAVHQTTKKGNYEGFTHANSSYNDNVLKRLYKRIHYMGGCVDCAPWRTRRNAKGTITVEKVVKRPKHC